MAVLAAFTLGAASPATASRVPQPVSPGAATPGVVAEARCPTFSWAGVQGARGFELAIFRISDEPGVEPVLVTRASVPGDARGYTPPVGRCLERGGRYAWSIAATTTQSQRDDRLEWSSAFLFEVEAPPSPDELQQAIATIQRYLEGATAADATVPRAWNGPSGDLDAAARAASSRRHHLGTGDGDAAGRVLPGALVSPSSAARISSAITLPPSLSVSNNIHLAAASNVLKAGDVFLWDDGSNTALGREALESVTTGVSNTAVGSEALQNTTGGTYPEGSRNTAVGFLSLSNNQSGYKNTATGWGSMYLNTLGHSNTAIGDYTLVDNVQGDRNIAIGIQAGKDTTGSDNILIGHIGQASENATIRIGSSTHTTAFLAGDVGLGFSFGEVPENRLHVRDGLSGSGLIPSNHVAQIENNSATDDADVLLLKVGRDHSDGGTEIGSGNNFITFLDGGDDLLGEFQGTTGGGIEFVSGNADFAEWLPRLNPAERIEPGDVVGLHGGSLSKRTVSASRVFVVSTAPIVTGNDPGEELRGAYARVAFLGQAPVKVRGPVREGDLLVASGRGDGIAIARSPEELSPADWPALVGRALENSEGVDASGTRLVRALVSLDSALAPTASRALERSLARLEHRMDRLEKRSAPLETAASAERAPTRRR